MDRYTTSNIAFGHRHMEPVFRSQWKSRDGGDPSPSKTGYPTAPADVCDDMVIDRVLDGLRDNQTLQLACQRALNGAFTQSLEFEASRSQ